MKTFTDSEQSKKLAEILLPESADMHYTVVGDAVIGDYQRGIINARSVAKAWKKNPDEYAKKVVPCWSLATLINVLPADWWGYNEHYFLEISKMGDASKPNKVCYYRFRKSTDGANYDRIDHISHSAENLVDACVNMIITLHEHKLLKEKNN